MPRPSKSKAQSDEAEDFSDVIDSSGSDDNSSEDEFVEDKWVFPAVEPNAKRPEFIEVCE